MADSDKKQPEGAECDCPKCGSDAIQNDSGVVCSNPKCENYGG